MREGITMGAAVVQTPEEKIAEARALLNRRVDQLQRNNGITTHSDLDITSAVMTIRALTDASVVRTEQRPPTDREIIRMANWHDACLLNRYLESDSKQYQRDLFQNGVYVLFDLHGSQLVPLFVEAIPRYVGESSILSQRLRHHAGGGWNSNPADHVVQEYLRASTQGEQAWYATAAKKEQLALRRRAMKRRRLWVRTTHTDSKKSALRLEDSLSQFYRDQGVDLWNDRPRPRPYIA